MKKYLVIAIIIYLIIGGASAITFYNTTDGTYNYTIINGTADTIQWTFPIATGIEILIVGGGGSSGYGNPGVTAVASGGAGGVLHGNMSVIGVYNITLGSGGTQVSGTNVNGHWGNPSIFGNTTNNWTAFGGGYGAASSGVGGAGGSGGGGGTAGTANQTSQSPLTGYGYNGGISSEASGGGSGGAASGTTVGPGRWINFTGGSNAPHLFVAQGGKDRAGTGWTRNGFGDGGSTDSSAVISQAGGNGTIVLKVLYVTTDPPIADFSAADTTIDIGTQAFFTDLSTNTPTEWGWDFGDDNWTGNTTANPSHLYTALGTYTVSLNATNAYGSNTTTKTNYITVANASAFTRQDIMMDPAYTITFQAKDGNGAFITSTDTTFIITSSDGTETDLTTSTGRTNTTLGYDLYSVAAGAEGYTSASTTFVASSDRTITLTLATATSSSDVSNTLYAPKTIGITVVRRNPAGIHVANAPISLVAIGSTLPVGTSESDSLQYIYGMNPTAANLMLNNTLIMAGTTGGDGSTGFTVLSTIGYTVTVTDPADSQVWTSTLYPSDPTGLYTIWIGANPIAEAANSTQAYLNQTRVWITEPDPANITFNLLYQDTSGDTSDVIFRVIASNNMTVIYQVDLGDPGTSAILANYTVPNIRGNAYYAGYNATRA